MDAFATKWAATQAQATILNPCHPVPVLIQPTSNQFNSAFVRRQWDCLFDFNVNHIGEAMGPLVGHSSDEDSLY